MSREQDAKIAEWMGWTDLFQDYTSGRYRLRGRPPGIGPFLLIPHFSTDRNPMAQAEAVAKERGLMKEYNKELLDVVCQNLPAPGEWDIAPGGWMDFHTATATAPQRAEALCRVIDGEAANG